MAERQDSDNFTCSWPENDAQKISRICSDSFTILGLRVLGLAVSRISESNCKRMSPEHFF